MWKPATVPARAPPNVKLPPSDRVTPATLIDWDNFHEAAAATRLKDNQPAYYSAHSLASSVEVGGCASVSSRRSMGTAEEVRQPSGVAWKVSGNILISGGGTASRPPRTPFL